MAENAFTPADALRMTKGDIATIADIKRAMATLCVEAIRDAGQARRIATLATIYATTRAGKSQLPSPTVLVTGHTMGR